MDNGNKFGNCVRCHVYIHPDIPVAPLIPRGNGSWEHGIERDCISALGEAIIVLQEQVNELALQKD